MNQNQLFWGTILILAGILLLLGNLGIITIDVWGVIWPVILILLGLRFILRLSNKRSSDRFDDNE